MPGVKDYNIGTTILGQLLVAIFMLSGYRNPNNKKFNNIGKRENCLLGDGNNVKLNKNNINHNNNNPRFGFSVRLLKHWCRSWSEGSAFLYFFVTLSEANGYNFIFFTSFRMTVLNTAKLFQDINRAYYDTRKHKRNTTSALTFEKNYEENLFNLRWDIINGDYKISPSICFIIHDPVQREVFAANFRDRIIHHLIYNYVYKNFDNHFIYDSYSCRLNKGTHFGIKRIDHFIRSCTHNYSRDAYILKLDIKGFFMHIDKHILFDQIKKVLCSKSSVSSFYSSPAPLQRSTEIEEILSSFLKEGRCEAQEDFKNGNSNFILSLIHQVIFHDPTKNCIIKGSKSDRNGLPHDKSLFYSPLDTGLAIGNLTSQLFANIYLDSMDKFIKYKLGCKYYGRYVDDFVIIHQDKDFLKSVIVQIEKYLKIQLKLELHPRKRYLQHYNKGVNFLGAYIKPYRIYIRKRTIGNFYKKIQFINEVLSYEKENISNFKDKILSITNSYIGILKHYKTYKIKMKLIKKFDKNFFSVFCFDKLCQKILFKIGF